MSRWQLARGSSERLPTIEVVREQADQHVFMFLFIRNRENQEEVKMSSWEVVGQNNGQLTV